MNVSTAVKKNSTKYSFTNEIGTVLTSPHPISARETTTSGNFISRDVPCILTAVDTAALYTTSAPSPTSGRTDLRIKGRNFWGTILGKIIKGVGKTVITIFVDSLSGTSDSEWVDLQQQGWNVDTDANGMKVTATSPDKMTVKEFVVKQSPSATPVPKEPQEHCAKVGGRTSCVEI